MSSEKNLTILLPTTTTTTTTTNKNNNNKDSDEDIPPPPSKPGRHLRRRRRLCYGICASLILVVVAITIIISFTVYKVQEPTMRLNSIHFNDNLDLSLTNNLTVVADVSVRNPNALPFTFTSSDTFLVYRSRQVGSGVGPPGEVGARRTLRTNVTVEVATKKLLEDYSGFMGDVGNGTLGMETSTAVVGGKVKILGLFRRHVGLVMNCSVTVSIGTQQILHQLCTQKMWL